MTVAAAGAPSLPASPSELRWSPATSNRHGDFSLAPLTEILRAYGTSLSTRRVGT